MEDFFSALEEIYERFHRKYLAEVTGSCNGCNYCCTEYFKYPTISSLEYDFIERNLENSGKKIVDFRNFMTHRDRPKCPFYSSSAGCTIYRLRPLCCRLFGIFGSDTVIPENCIYKGMVKKIEERILFRTESELRKFQILKLNYEVSKAENKDDKLKAFIKLTEELIAQNQLDSAAQTLEVMAALYPDNPSFYFYSGLIFKWKGNIPQAIIRLKKCIKFGGEKTYPYIYEYLGLIYYETDELEKARKTLKEAINILPQSPQAHTVMALIHIKEASQYCKKALELDPENPVVIHLMEKYFSEECNPS